MIREWLVLDSACNCDEVYDCCGCGYCFSCNVCDDSLEG